MQALVHVPGLFWRAVGSASEHCFRVIIVSAPWDTGFQDITAKQHRL
jgi:hypothetical protein